MDTSELSTKQDSIIFHPKDEPLRLDVGWLGALVGAVVREQGGEALYELVERTRQCAISGRDDTEFEPLAAKIRGLDPQLALDVIRAFSTYFQAVNLAERVHRIRRGRDYARDGARPQPGGIADTVITLKARAVPLEHIVAALNASSVEPVFTAHPTEATRRIILEKEQRLARRLIERLDPSLTPAEARANDERIGAEITTAWQTEEHPPARLTVANEREHVLFYITDVIYRIVPPLYESLHDALERAYGLALAHDEVAPSLRIGSWVGGDMDGNPNVSAQTIAATLEEHRNLIISRYLAEVESIYEQLSQSSTRVGVSDAVLARCAHYGQQMPDVRTNIPERLADMPYRELLRYVSRRLAATRKDARFAYASASELSADLNLIESSLLANRGRHAGLFALRRLERRVATFGFHLATLDVRQDTVVHRDVIAHGLAEPDWATLPRAARTTRLCQALHRGEVPSAPWRDQDERVLDVFRAIESAKGRFGERAIGPYIVSMSEGADDVLSVLMLARWVGLEEQGQVPLDVVPLFETVSDLERCADVFTSLLDLEVYKDHLRHRGTQQMVMLGYSDSNKDSGFAASRFAVYAAQARLNRVAEAHSVRLTLFHGSGGTRSRGDSSAHKALLMDSRTEGGIRYRVTEQGEVIDARYGLRNIATRTFERSISSVLLAALQHSPTSSEHEAFEVLAAASREKYRALVYGTPRFVDFFRQTTPIDVIERLAIGSRPSARRSKSGIENLRAIPWVFAWTQSRYYLTGWYGLGTGLEHAMAQFGQRSMRALAENDAFLSSLLADAEFVLAKADLGIASRYAELADVDLRDYFSDIQQEYDKTVSALLALRSAGELLEHEPVFRRSIRLRNPYVDPMSLLQIDLLQRWRASAREDESLLRALRATVNGIARGLQSTG